VEIGNFFSTRKATDVTFRAIRFPTSPPSLFVSISLFLLMRHYVPVLPEISSRGEEETFFQRRLRSVIAARAQNA